MPCPKCSSGSMIPVDFRFLRRFVCVFTALAAHACAVRHEAFPSPCFRSSKSRIPRCFLAEPGRGNLHGGARLPSRSPARSACIPKSPGCAIPCTGFSGALRSEERAVRRLSRQPRTTGAWTGCAPHFCRRASGIRDAPPSPSLSPPVVPPDVPGHLYLTGPQPGRLLTKK